MACGASNAGDQMRQQQIQQQKLTDQSVGKINQAFSGFTPQFFQGIQNDYQNYALPQLQNQYQQTQNRLGFKLANQGLLGSSVGQDLYNKLGQAQTQSQQQIASQGLQQSQDMQRQVAQQKAQLIGQAQQATDPLSVGQQAIAIASGFSAPSSFQPIGQAFGNFADLYLANQLRNTYNPATAGLMSLGYGGGLGSSTGFLPSTSFGGR